MRDVPQHINTRADFDRVAGMGRDGADLAQCLVVEAKAVIWVDTGVLPEDKIGVTDAVHRVVTEENDGVTVRRQQALKRDPASRLARLRINPDDLEPVVIEETTK